MEKSIDPSKITKFYFDTNIYSHIFIGYQGRKYVDIIKNKQSSNEFMIHFTIVNLVELLQEWSEGKFEEVKAKLQQASKIVGGGNILEDPETHVQRPVRKYLGLPDLPLRKEWVNLPWRLSRANSWVEAERLIKPINDYILRKKQEWLESMKLMINIIHSLQERMIAEGLYLSAEDWYDSFEVYESFPQANWKACIKHFKLPTESHSITSRTARAQFASFRYWMEFFYQYYRKVTVKNRKPRPSDYFDSEQSIYLNVMDYWVSNDPRARACMKYCTDPTGNPRCISLSKFYNYLSDKIPVPCAPEQASMVPYRTQNQN